MIRFSCENCEKKLKVPVEYASKRVKCPSCETALVVPEPPAPEQSADEANIFSDLKSDLEMMESQGAADYEQNQALRESRLQDKEQDIDDSQWHETPKKKKPGKSAVGEIAVDAAKLPLAIALGAGGALVGAFLWALVVKITGYEIGWIAIGVGFLTGLGFTLSGASLNNFTGVIAAVLAVVGIFAGKYIAVTWILNENTTITVENAADLIEMNQDCLAFAAVFEMANNGEISELQQLEHDNAYYDALDIASISPEIKELHSKALTLGSSWDKRTACQKVVDWFNSQMKEELSGVATQGVIETLGPLDLLFVFLAIATAFRMGNAGSE